MADSHLPAFRSRRVCPRCRPWSDPFDDDRLRAEGDRIPTEAENAGLVVFVKPSDFLRRRQVSPRRRQVISGRFSHLDAGCSMDDKLLRSANAAVRFLTAAKCKRRRRTLGPVWLHSRCRRTIVRRRRRNLASRCIYGGGTADGGNCLNAAEDSLARRRALHGSVRIYITSRDPIQDLFLAR